MEKRATRSDGVNRCSGAVRWHGAHLTPCGIATGVPRIPPAPPSLPAAPAAPLPPSVSSGPMPGLMLCVPPARPRVGAWVAAAVSGRASPALHADVPLRVQAALPGSRGVHPDVPLLRRTALVWFWFLEKNTILLSVEAAAFSGKSLLKPANEFHFSTFPPLPHKGQAPRRGCRLFLT